MLENRPLGEILAQNIPEFLQSSDNLIAYLEAAGVYLDGVRDEIIQFDFARDYEKGSAYNIEQSLLSLGLTIPPLLSDALRRLILRDAVETFIRKGTEDALVWVLRIIGLEPEVRHAWLPSAAEVKKGYIIDPVTKVKVRYSPDRFTYNQFLYGEEIYTDDGVFFEGYTYSDTYNENKIGPLPIMGQTYDAPQSNRAEAVASTPYLVVRVNDQQYNAVTDPYIGSDGQEYEYTNLEAFRVVNDLIDYFLFQLNKPTHTRIIIVSLQIFDPEGLEIAEEFSDTFTHDPEVFTDADLEIGSEFASTGQITLTPLVVGGLGLVVGEEVPFESSLSVTDGGVEIGVDPQTHPEKVISDWSTFPTRTYVDKQVAGLSRPITIRALTSVQFKAPTDSLVRVRGIFNKGDLNDYDLIGTVQPNAPFYFVNDHRYHLIQLDYESDSDENVLIELVHTGNY